VTAPVSESARLHVTIATAVQAAFSVMGLIGFVICIIMTVRATGIERQPHEDPEMWEHARAISIGIVWIFGALALIYAAWGALNAWGMRKLKPWARVSSLAASGLALPLCCFMPLGIYGLYALTRADVRAVFTAASRPGST
jgi:hypothetical protein